MRILFVAFLALFASVAVADENYEVHPDVAVDLGYDAAVDDPDYPREEFYCRLDYGVHRSGDYSSRGAADNFCNTLYQVLGRSHSKCVIKRRGEYGSYRWGVRFDYAHYFEGRGYDYSDIRKDLFRQFGSWHSRTQLHRYSRIRPYVFFSRRCG